MGSVPVGVQCHFTSSLGEFVGYWAGSGILGYPSFWCPSPFPSPSISRCFPFPLLHLPLDCIRVFPLRPMYLHPFGRPFTYSLLSEFPGLGLALEPDVVVREAEHCACVWSRNLDPNFCHGRGRTSDLGIYRLRTLPLDYRVPHLFSRLLRHAGGYSGTIITPNSQGVI